MIPFVFRTLPAVVCLLLVQVLAANAQLVFEQREVELKPAFGEATLEAFFPFKNTSDKTVTVQGMSSSCGCTVPELEKKIYAPGESGVMKAIYSVGNRQGLQMLTITMRTDHGELSAQLRVQIPPRFKMEPRILTFPRAAAAEREVKLSYLEDTPVTIEKIESADKDFTVTSEPVKPGTQWKLKVAYQGNKNADARTLVLVRTKGASGNVYSDYLHVLAR